LAAVKGVLFVTEYAIAVISGDSSSCAFPLQRLQTMSGKTCSLIGDSNVYEPGVVLPRFPATCNITTTFFLH